MAAAALARRPRSMAARGPSVVPREPAMPDKPERSASGMSARASSNKKLNQSDSKEDSLDTASRASESLKADRLSSSKNEEDWRRRTIIVEKKNGSYGFTLQSYGIHYKKEQEIEMITYVDYVEFDGPAHRAGMREGDVIVAINGSDVERAEHAAVVALVGRCDARMRMVVIFEDCVRKVDLHVKYINLQRLLQLKMRELDQVTVRERQILDGNWKTHSLPSQKKKNSPADNTSDNEDMSLPNVDNISKPYCRPTLSSENVTTKQNKKHRISFMYQYLDPHYGTCLIQPDLRNGSFVVSVGSPRNRQDYHHIIVKTPSELPRLADKQVHCHNGAVNANKVPKKSSHSHGCPNCIPAQGNQDSNSLEAYDLASPCCDPHCVPNTRRKSRRPKECSKEHRRKDKSHYTEKENTKSENYNHHRPRKVCSSSQCSGTRYRYVNIDSAQNSQCSLQSCAASNLTVTAPSCDNSNSSYSTSLSSDTLFWDMEKQDPKSSPKQVPNQQYQQAYHPQYKPKSWDNLTTKAFGGYGFGYGYLDTITKHVNRSKSHSRSQSNRSTQSHHGYHQHSHSEKHAMRHNPAPQYAVYPHQHGHGHCFPPTKSTESLLVLPKYHIDPNSSDPRMSCECLEGNAGIAIMHSNTEYYRRSANMTGIKSPNDSRSSGYYTQHLMYPNSSGQKKKDDSMNSEITRL